MIKEGYPRNWIFFHKSSMNLSDKQPGFFLLCFSFSLSVHIKKEGGFPQIYEFIVDNVDKACQ